MILTAVVIGAAIGTVVTVGMFRSGMLAERSGAAVLLALISVFYPIFAIIEGDHLATGLHLVIALGFIALATRAFRVGMSLIAGGLIAHGLFDAALGLIMSPGPDWWPAFCAGVDMAVGIGILRLIQIGKVPQ